MGSGIPAKQGSLGGEDFVLTPGVGIDPSAERSENPLYSDLDGGKARRGSQEEASEDDYDRRHPEGKDPPGSRGAES